jgi:hypothetical protein
MYSTKPINYENYIQLTQFEMTKIKGGDDPVPPPPPIDDDKGNDGPP